MKALNAFFLANYLAAPQKSSLSMLQNPKSNNLVPGNLGSIQIKQCLENKDRFQENFVHRLTDSLSKIGITREQVEIAQPKEESRIWEKARQGEEVKDIFRARVIVNLTQSQNIRDSIVQISHDIAICMEAQEIKVIEVKNFYDSPYPSGLRLVKIHLQFPNFVAELQVISEKFAKIAGSAFDHALYKSRRKTEIDTCTHQVILKIQKDRYCPVAIDEGFACQPGDPCFEHWLRA